MRGRVERTVLAREDSLKIWEYIALDDPHAADRVIERIDEAIQRLARMPWSGTPREELRPDLRSAPVGKYLAFYTPLQDGIRVTRIPQGNRDLPRQFVDDESE